MSQCEDLAGQLWALQGIAPASPDGFTRLNDDARELVRRAAAVMTLLDRPSEAMWVAHWRALRLSPAELRAWLASNLRNRGPHESGCVTSWHAMVAVACENSRHSPDAASAGSPQALAAVAQSPTSPPVL